MPSDRETAFRNQWQELSRHGKCDSLDGSEYRRVLEDWRLAGEPLPAEHFIAVRANLGPWSGPAHVDREGWN